MAFYEIDDFNRDKFRDTLLAENYTLLHEDTTEIAFQAQDPSWSFGIQRKVYNEGMAFSPQNEAWLFNMFSNFDSSTDFFLQQDGITQLHNNKYNLNFTSMAYSRTMKNKAWLNVNSQRIILVVRFGLDYQAFYIGKMNSYTSSVYYEKPWVLTGSCGYTSTYYSPIFDQDSKNIHGLTCREACSYIKDKEGYWHQITGENVSNEGQRIQEFALYPFQKGISNLTKNIDNSITLLPSIIVGNKQNMPDDQQFFWGELEIYKVPGFDAAPEDTITVENEDYICFPADRGKSDNFVIMFAIKKS